MDISICFCFEDIADSDDSVGSYLLSSQESESEPTSKSEFVPDDGVAIDPCPLEKKASVQNDECPICISKPTSENVRVYLRCDHWCCMSCANTLCQMSTTNSMKCFQCRKKFLASSHMRVAKRKYSRWSITSSNYTFFRSRFTDSIIHEDNYSQYDRFQGSTPIYYRSKSTMTMNVPLDLDQHLNKLYARYKRSPLDHEFFINQIMDQGNGRKVWVPVLVDFKRMVLHAPLLSQMKMKLVRNARNVSGIAGYIFRR